MHAALRREHIGRKLQVYDPGHLGRAFSRASTSAPPDVIPGPEYAIRVLRTRTHEQLHRELVRGCNARTRRRARDGHSQLETRDQSRRGAERVAQGAVSSSRTVDPLGRRDGLGHDGGARWGRACVASEREGALFVFFFVARVAHSSRFFLLL